MVGEEGDVANSMLEKKLSHYLVGFPSHELPRLHRIIHYPSYIEDHYDPGDGAMMKAMGSQLITIYRQPGVLFSHRWCDVCDVTAIDCTQK